MPYNNEDYDFIDFGVSQLCVCGESKGPEKNK